MRTKFLVLLPFLIILFVVFLLNKEDTGLIGSIDSISNEKMIKSLPTQISSKVNEPQGFRSPLKASGKSNQELSADDYDRLVEQIKNRKYSDDIGVELISLGMEYESCGNNNWGWRFKNKELSAKQNQIRASVEAKCQKLQSKYPLLHSKTFIRDMGQVFEEFPSETQLGQFIKDSFNAAQSGGVPDDVLPRGLLSHGVKAKNSQIVKMAEWMTKFRSNQFLFDRDIINGQDFMYLHHVQSIAITSISCEFQNGLTCDSTSQFMHDKCFEDDRFCGLDFDQWYAAAVLPGLDKDVQILKKHLSHLPTP